jgi:hypothetical protein
VFLTLWLALFCQHCLTGSAAAPAGTSLPGSTAPDDHAGHPGTAPDCNGACLDVHVLQQDWPDSGAAMMAPASQPFAGTPPAAAARPATTVREHALLHHPPERAFRHPLTLTSIQLK